MSSFNVHKHEVLNNDKPIDQRFSHLRSCANKVANLLNCTRNQLVKDIIYEVSVNIEESRDIGELIIALNYLLLVRSKHLNQ